MRKQLSLLLLNLIIVGLSYGQKIWINLNHNLKITDTVWKVEYKAQYLHDSSNFKIYNIIKTNDNCENDYSGFLNSIGGLNSISGKMVLYHNNHQIKSKGNYLNGFLEGEWIEYYDNGQIDNQGEFVNGKRNNIWFWYFKNGQVSSKEKYEMDELISVEMWDSTGQQVTNPEKVDRMPMVKKGNKDMIEFRKFVGRNLKYPKESAENNVSGKVILQFCIDQNGNLKNEKVVKGYDKFLNQEALRVVRLAQKWFPAIQHNRKTAMSITFPLTFVVQ